MKRLKTFVFAVLAGLCIGIGGTVYLLLENKVLGATLFTIGLFSICTFGYNLYTGKVCYVFEREKSYILDVGIIWVGNLVGTWLTAQLELLTRIGPKLQEAALKVCEAKLSDDLLSIFVLAIFCNILICVGVEGFNRSKHDLGKYLALFFGVVVFILCSFEHCVANMYYFSVAGVWSLRTFGYLLIMTLGNAVGGVIIPLGRKFGEKIG
ncbi:MAG: formate/nitrite transporter family protein [Clostridia bacterium]|nr:formate/nitrite transporter family protein [Clostridiales bacterium]MBQ7113042.1 formate/nitrite transporter family protein [Clostridia bacterium]